ncbi:MAG: hypothetical protein M1823_002536 [Watsoniomyces obsoletus]|nr:MAG: hypothetical protein M1823_002536 [Watsoniomyces obsoletus]
MDPFWTAYLLGVLTVLLFLSLPVVLFLLYFYFVLPRHDASSESATNQDTLEDWRAKDRFTSPEYNNIRKHLVDRSSENDVAAGYFAVCREYVPGGLNGKPPERTTPAGEVVASESPSIYQNMYRTIFDRNKAPSTEVGRNIRRARNVFYVVRRHGHLMLYDDAEQVEVRHVIALYHYDIGIYGGGEPIPEGELYIRRNAISLTKRAADGTSGVDDPSMRPFFFFSDNCSEKEDFYLALLQQRDGDLSGGQKGPTAQKFNDHHMVSLFNRLQLKKGKEETGWINMLTGRLFLALYKTSEIEQFVRAKLTKKIARVKKPAFLSDVIIQKIDLGEAPPYISNPKPGDINVDGSCSVEMDIEYSGNFKIQVATKARIELGSRFKTREVDLVLSVVLKKLEGHVIVKFKPPPSNRIWVTFVTMPKMEMSIEPIVSSRQITYNIILRAIESRIREVVAETVVSPNWDDIPFADTMSKRFRGGIWREDEAGEEEEKKEESERHDVPAKTEEEVDTPKVPPTAELPENEKEAAKSPDTSIPPASTSDSPTDETFPSQPAPRNQQRSRASSTTIERKPTMNTPKSLRPAAYAAASAAIVGTDTTTVDAFKENRKGERHDAASRMIAISSRAQSQSPSTSPIEAPFERPLTSRSHTSTTSKERPELIRERKSRSTHDQQDPETIRRTTSRTNSIDTITTATSSSTTTNPTTEPPRIQNRGSLGSMPGFGNDPKLNTLSASGTLGSLGSSSGASTSRNSLSSIGSATASVARKWGWRSFNKNGERDLNLSKPEIEGSGSNGNGNVKEGTPDRPIGRGRPLPPPGTPLPMPEKEGVKRVLTTAVAGAAPKRKPVAASSIVFKPSSVLSGVASASDSALPSSSAVPNRRQKEGSSSSERRRQDGVVKDDAPARAGSGGGDGHRGERLLVVAAPSSYNTSQPSSPLNDSKDARSEVGKENEENEEEESSPPPSSFELADDGNEERSTRSIDVGGTSSLSKSSLS